MIGQGKVITVWSPVGNNGTTFNAINLAKRLNDTKGKTLLVDLNLKSPRISDYLLLQDMLHNLDNMFSYIAGNNLSKEIILANIEQKDGLDVLKGTQNTQQADYINVNSILPIIEILKDIYSYIVIDCSTALNAGTYVALKEADVVLALLTKDIITTMTFNEMKPLLFANFNDSKFKFIINKDSDKIFMPKQEIEKFLEIEITESIPFLGIELSNDINKGQAMGVIDKKGMQHYQEAIDSIIKNCILEDKDVILKKKKKRGFSLSNVFKK